MKFKEFIIRMFSSNAGVSSKRVIGAIILLTLVGVLIYCTIKVVQAPEFADTMSVLGSSLLGLDSVTDIWKKGKKHLDDNNNA